MSFVNSFDDDEIDYGDVSANQDNAALKEKKEYGFMIDHISVEAGEKISKKNLKAFLVSCGLTPSSIGREGKAGNDFSLVDEHIGYLDLISASLKQIKDKIEIVIDKIKPENIPVLPFKNNPEEKDYCGEYKTVDLFGIYISGKGIKKAKIIIDTNKIRAHYRDGKNFNAILVTILMHEFMHALMDPYNYSSYCDAVKDGLNVEYTTEYGYWKEESYANALTLKLMRLNKWPVMDDYPFKKAREFMEGQSDAYAYGVKLLDINIDHSQWIKQKINGVSKILKKRWLEKAFLSIPQD